jgi:hypothetical protein
MFPLSEILKTKPSISETSTGETAHLKKIPMENMYVS